MSDELEKASQNVKRHLRRMAKDLEVLIKEEVIDERMTVDQLIDYLKSVGG